MRSRSLWFLALAALLFAGQWGLLGSRDLSAQGVTVIDGDTVQVGDQIYQLYGIDAPELGQLCDVNGDWKRCGVEAALALAKLLAMAGESLKCSPWQDGGAEHAGEPGVTVAVCQTGTQDVGQVMLHGGYSVALPGSFPDYQDAQAQAREGSLGLWHSKFTLPWQWRQGVRLPDEQTECNVKAVIGDAGERVYYVPTDPNYDQIRPDAARSDTLLCSDEEARLAGWRRPGEPTMVN